MPSKAATSYDEIPYLGHAYNFTHPDRLSVMGALLGLRPAPVESCRVLELGCGDGANLLPMAYTLPQSAFFGIDLAVKPVEQGHAYAAELGLSNLRLEAMDIMDFPADAGQFDYIIAHGVYSWVPAFVREKILAICGAHLAPHGIAYVSYKVFPGSHVTATIHEMLRYQASRRPGASEQEIVQAGIEMLRLSVTSKQKMNPFQVLLNWRLESIDKRMESYGGYSWIYHDLGVEISDPVYFHQFMREAEGHGLQFLSEPSLNMPDETQFTPEAVEALAALDGDVVAQEQYRDFLSFREFRRSLLCQADVVVDRSLPPERLRSLYASSPLEAVPSTEPSDDPLAKEEFLAPGGLKVTVDQPVVKAALRRLGQVWPNSVSFDELLAASDSGDRKKSPAGQAEDVDRLGSTLLAVFRADMINLTTRAPKMAATVSERPVSSARLRQQIAHEQEIVTNLRHVEMEVKDSAVRQLLTLLDGTRDRAGLLRELHVWLDEVRPHAPTLPTREWVDENIDMVLAGFARQQFLVA